MIYFFYNILLTFFIIFTASYFLLKALFEGRIQRELTQRIGLLPDLSEKRPLWIHAASVGEVFCVIPIIKRIKHEFPDSCIVLTTMTRTGNESARKKVPEANHILFFPFDHPVIIRNALRRISPGLLLIVETEIWPNLLWYCGKMRIPVFLINGRISEISFRKYRFFKFFFRKCLENVSLFLMQTEMDRKRIIEIGADEEKVRVIGNMKFDQTPPSSGGLEPEISDILGSGDEKYLIVAGSTHSGEEEIFADIFKDLSKLYPGLFLLLAPRHLERLEEVEKVLKGKSLLWTRRTSLSLNQDQRIKADDEVAKIVLLDTMGELWQFYSMATLVFIGGSLVRVGGHNPLEPLFFKKCVIFGPHMFNFSEIAHSLVKSGAAIQVKDKDELLFQLKCLLSDEEQRREVGEKGYQFLKKYQGATERTFQEIRAFFK